jgi:ribonuclease BN (tRNA processing enzyme)
VNQKPDSDDASAAVGGTRRQVLRTAAVLSGAAAAAPVFAATAAAASATPTPTPSSTSTGGSGAPLELVLLGTAAGPVPMIGRTGIASALIVDGRIYLIDMGHGAFDQFTKANLDIADLDRVFITHLHSDHVADLYTMLWLRFGGINPLTHPLDIWGPGPAGALPAPYNGGTVPTVDPQNPTPGTTELINTQIAATAYDVNIRMRDEGWPDIESMMSLHDIALPASVGASAPDNLTPAMQPFTVMSDEHVTVSAILVQHPPVFPSYAFRFDTAHGSVVFSGDTTVTQNMVTLAQGADVLVHEAIDIAVMQKSQSLSAAQVQHLENSHTDVTKVGAIAQQAGVKTLVLSHLAPGTKALPDSVWKANASKGFDGKVIVGNDLMRIPV